jgi:hypothetical protein
MMLTEDCGDKAYASPQPQLSRRSSITMDHAKPGPSVVISRSEDGLRELHLSGITSTHASPEDHKRVLRIIDLQYASLRDERS